MKDSHCGSARSHDRCVTRWQAACIAVVVFLCAPDASARPVRADDILFSDSNAKKIWQLDPNTGVVEVFAEGGFITAAPRNLARGPRGFIFLQHLSSDSEHGGIKTRIIRLDPTTADQQLVFESSSEFPIQPGSDLDVAPDGSLVIADDINDVVWRLYQDSTAEEITSGDNFLSGGSAQFKGVVVEDDGTIQVITVFHNIVTVDPVTGEQSLFSLGSTPALGSATDFEKTPPSVGTWIVPSQQQFWEIDPRVPSVTLQNVPGLPFGSAFREYGGRLSFGGDVFSLQLSLADGSLNQIVRGSGTFSEILYGGVSPDGTNSRILGLLVIGGTDSDGDQVLDNFDNCESTPNTDQANADTDAWGDVCDNCPFVGNILQEDVDGDGIGDACQCGDVDVDGDIDFIDVFLIRRFLSGQPVTVEFEVARCSVSRGSGDCGILDLVLLRRLESGVVVTIENVCAAAGGP